MTSLLERWRRAWQARRDRRVRWSAYCRPEAVTMPQVFEIGIERVTLDGRVLGRTPPSIVPIDDVDEREAAMRAAHWLAQRFNDAKVGM